MARTKSKKVEESFAEEKPKKRVAAKVNRSFTNKSQVEEINEMPNNAEECSNECQCSCGGPLVREFNTYEDFHYIFTYGGCKEFCGNTMEKISVVLKTSVMPIPIGDYQCVCIKRPMITGNDNRNFATVDIDLGTNGFPMGALYEFLTKNFYEECGGNPVQTVIDVCFNSYLQGIAGLDIGVDFAEMPTSNVVINEVCTGEYFAHDSVKETRAKINQHNIEARYIVTVTIPTNSNLLDNVVFTTIGMEFVRQFMAAVNTTLALADSSSIFKPDIVEIFRRNIRHEISQNYYPGGFREVIEFVGSALRANECCNECDENSEYMPEDYKEEF